MLVKTYSDKIIDTSVFDQGIVRLSIEPLFWFIDASDKTSYYINGFETNSKDYFNYMDIIRPEYEIVVHKYKNGEVSTGVIRYPEVTGQKVPGLLTVSSTTTSEQWFKCEKIQGANHKDFVFSVNVFADTFGVDIEWLESGDVVCSFSHSLNPEVEDDFHKVVTGVTNSNEFDWYSAVSQKKSPNFYKPPPPFYSVILDETTQNSKTNENFPNSYTFSEKDVIENYMKLSTTSINQKLDDVVAVNRTLAIVYGDNECKDDFIERATRLISCFNTNETIKAVVITVTGDNIYNGLTFANEPSEMTEAGEKKLESIKRKFAQVIEVKDAR